MYTLKFNPEYTSISNYSLSRAKISLFESVEITNTSDIPVEYVTVTCSGEFVIYSTPLEFISIQPGETVRGRNFVVVVSQSKLADLKDRVASTVKLTAMCKGEIVGEEDFEIEFLPYNYWTGTTIMPQSLMSLITPDHPVIRDIVAKSAELLEQATGSSTFNQYRTGDINDVRQQVAAVFAALHGMNLSLSDTPVSYDTLGQHIALPPEMIAPKSGNSLELTLLMASVLEAIGINCIIILQNSHAYLGIWLVNDNSPSSVNNDPAFIEKKCANGVSEMLVLECSTFAQEDIVFEEAVRMAETRLADHSVFEMSIDLKQSRLEGIKPIPTKIYDPAADPGENEDDASVMDVEEHERYDLSLMPNSDKELTKFDIWERKLLDFTLRNSLLNISLRRRAIQFMSFDISKIELMVQEGKEFCTQSKPDIEIPYYRIGKFLRSKMYESCHQLIINDIDHLTLHSFLSETETKTVLKNIYRVSKSTLEETGANSLFLSIGALRWYENDKTPTPRYAPLLLLPVELIYKKSKYYIRMRDEEITINITLMEFLRQNYDIDIRGLNPLPTTDGGRINVSLIYALIRNALKEQKRWDIEEECVLGLFSFSKFLLWNDVHSHRDELEKNEIIRSFVENRLTWEANTLTDNLKNIDMNLNPADIALPVPVDSSQLAAVIEGSKGNSFIIYGPPGTGKSQTITNLIANALYHGKRVLFVAQKMAALSIVQSRLQKIGIDAFCLELHSNKATKRHVLQQLGQALASFSVEDRKNYLSQANKLFAARKELAEYMQALHTPDPADGLSPYDCILRYESIPVKPLDEFLFEEAIDSFLIQEGVSGLESLLGNEFAALLRIVGQPSQHPLLGLHVDQELLMNIDTVEKQMRQDSQYLSDCMKDYDDLRVAKVLRTELETSYRQTIFNIDPENTLQQYSEAKSKWFLRRIFAERKLLSSLKQFSPYIRLEDIEPLMEKVIAYRQRHSRISELQRIIKKYSGEEYSGEEYSGEELPSESFITDVIAKLSRWTDNSDRISDWFHWSEYSRKLRQSGMGRLVDILETTEQDLSTVKDAYLKALFKYKARKKISRAIPLATFEGTLFEEKVSAYKNMTEEFQLLTQKELYTRLAAGISEASKSDETMSERMILRHAILNGGRGKVLRDIFEKLPTLLPRLCPCMLMSPLSVAQYIDINADKFDLVIFDEASQMPTCEAIGAIARGKSLIVVGDPKQMPPTSFFNSTNVDTEEVDIDDLESVLDDCRSLNMPALQLSWHYRSRHESLIAFSNNEYYDGSLITFPSVDDQSAKIHFVPITGCYDKGGQRSNRAEAEAIVDEIVRRLKNYKLRKKSIGVIAFSVPQQTLIDDILQERLDRNKTLMAAAAQMYEPIFIKNLENVQGDERDVILFSIGYGPDKFGKVSMNFGPLNVSGGERRLNVAVSRAREEMYVFSTLKSSDIDLRRSKSLGVEGLKHFLEYAQTQTLPTAAQRDNTPNASIIANKIASELRQHGYVVATDVGRSKFRVDVAVEHPHKPGTYCLGILLDGNSYGDTFTTRDREVVQPSVLEALNWKVMRIRALDWFSRRDLVIFNICLMLKYRIR